MLEEKMDKVRILYMLNDVYDDIGKYAKLLEEFGFSSEVVSKLLNGAKIENEGFWRLSCEASGDNYISVGVEWNMWESMVIPPQYGTRVKLDFSTDLASSWRYSEAGSESDLPGDIKCVLDGFGLTYDITKEDVDGKYSYRAVCEIGDNGCVVLEW